MQGMFIRFPGGRKKALTLSYDDGVEQDLRLLSVMKTYGLKGTFNLNSGLYAKEGTIYAPDIVHRRMSQKQITDAFEKSGMEIAVHGLTHAALEQLPANLCIAEVTKDRENLEKQFSRLVRGMAYAAGSYDDKVINCLECAGIAYARTVISTHDFRLPKDWYRLTSTCHHRDSRLMELAHQFVDEVPVRLPWLFYLWGHSYEFEIDGNWDRIDMFANYMGGRDSIWYATNIEIHDYIKAYRKLMFSMDESLVYNPTDCEVYFVLNDKSYSVNPGETKKIEMESY